MNITITGAFAPVFSANFQGGSTVVARTVALYAADKTTLLGATTVNNTTPGSPQIIIWKNMTFIAGPMVYGPASPPGTYQAYYQSTYTMSLPASGVTPPSA